MTDELFSIGRMCAEFGVTPRTLRFYESKELLFPVRQGTRRLFTRACRARLRLILQGKRFGFSLESIRQLLELYAIDDQQVTQIERSCALGRERLSAMQAQRDELDDAIADLRKQLEWGEQMLAARGSDRFAADEALEQ